MITLKDNICLKMHKNSVLFLHVRFLLYALCSSVLQFDWLGFVKAVVESKVEPVQFISSSEPVIVRVPQYFKELFKLINNTDPRYTHTHTRTYTGNTQTDEHTLGLEGSCLSL